MNSNLIIKEIKEDKGALEFCKQFLNSSKYPKYLFGRNIYANAIVDHVKIDGFIDDYYKESMYLGIPVFKLEDIPLNSLVLVISGGKVKTAMNKVNNLNIANLDYFSFYKYSGLQLTEIIFNENFYNEFETNKLQFNWIYNLLSDDISKEQFSNLVNFKLSYDLNFLKDFDDKEDQQYFENFLQLKEEGEVFLDVGAYDGYTSEEFIKISPKYKAIHIFEPDENNLLKAKERLKNYSNIVFHNQGLSSKKDTLKFDIGGSTSKISDTGIIEVKVDMLDSIIKEQVTFIKIDIEGAESDAIEGAVKTILDNHPMIAISVYHKVEDFWKIPKQILDIRDDYKIYLRHYTESIYETVMFFIPLQKD